jgi:predicted RNase H-like HicB family nuclease
MSALYEVIIYWSAEDDAFLAEVPELPGCMTHGETRAEALANAEEAMELWLEIARQYKDRIPEPRQRRPSSA